MTPTRRVSVEAKDLGDAIVVRLEVGMSDTPSRRFHPGQPAPTFSIGTRGVWKIDAPGVAPIHAYGRFDGRQLFVATADPDDPVLVDGRTVPETWLALVAPATLSIGEARVAIESRFSSEFPAAVPSGAPRPEAATRIDIEPLWAGQVDPAPSTDGGAPASEQRAEEPRSRRSSRALLFVLGTALAAVLAYRFVRMRDASPAPAAALGEAPAPAASLATPSTSIEPAAPIEQPRPAVPPLAPIALVPTAAASAAGKTVEREAVDALTAGDFAKAAGLYRALIEARPNQPAFKEALRILEERSHAR